MSLTKEDLRQRARETTECGLRHEPEHSFCNDCRDQVDRVEAALRSVQEETINAIAADPDRYKGFKERIRIMVQEEAREACALIAERGYQPEEIVMRHVREWTAKRIAKLIRDSK